MEPGTIKRGQVLQWFKLQRLALMLDFEPKTIRRWWKEGKFGPPEGGRAEDYFFTVGEGTGADVRISSRGYEYFLAHHTQSSAEMVAPVVSGRTPGEARRELLRVVGG